jgi:hypothetical protein
MRAYRRAIPAGPRHLKVGVHADPDVFAGFDILEPFECKRHADPLLPLVI